MGTPLITPLAERSVGVEVVEAVNLAGEIRVLATLISPLPLMEERERRMGFPVKSKFLLLVVRKVILMM